jgi:hypothetical protein
MFNFKAILFGLFMGGCAYFSTEKWGAAQSLASFIGLLVFTAMAAVSEIDARIDRLNERIQKLSDLIGKH